MTKFAFLPLTAALSVSMAAPALASASDQPIVLEHQDQRYVYTVTNHGSTRAISGVEENSGKRFNLRVRGDRVRGEFGTASVSFRASEAQGSVTALIAAR